ncbi:hypothetical protein ACLOJK_010785 [Asimina triloba]
MTGQKIALAVPGQTQYALWKVNKVAVWDRVLDEMYHATLNLNQRLAHELEQEHEGSCTARFTCTACIRRHCSAANSPASLSMVDGSYFPASFRWQHRFMGRPPKMSSVRLSSEIWAVIRVANLDIVGIKWSSSYTRLCYSSKVTKQFALGTYSRANFAHSGPNTTKCFDEERPKCWILGKWRSLNS